MFCRKCYSSLDDSVMNRCPKCGRQFDPAKPGTELPRPFPSKSTIAAHVIATTLLAIVGAFVVATHQMARTSGH